MDSSKNSNGNSPHHVILFPYMSKGHTIALLHLARLLLLRKIHVTVFTTPSNRPFIADFLADTTTIIIDIPFPDNIPEIPSGVESTEKLPSMSLFAAFTRATKLMQPEFERAVQSLPPVSFMVSDGFLWWTLESAKKFGFPRLVFYGMNTYASVVSTSIGRLLVDAKSDDEPITVPAFPWITVTRGDYDPVFYTPDLHSPELILFTDQIISSSQSQGFIVNSFYELEPKFIDHSEKEQIKSWFVGPLCLAEPEKPIQPNKPSWSQWLDSKIDRPVLYVAFGSQAEISPEQLREIMIGLEESEVNFLWVTKWELDDKEFDERVKERGIVVREWVDQREILSHRNVGGFLSHCGWNSALESICSGVPILAWPMMAEQPLNAKFVVEEIKVGLRMESCDGRVKGFVTREGFVKMVKELMEGEMGKMVRKNVKEFAEMGKKAMEEKIDSSWCGLESLINEIC